MSESKRMMIFSNFYLPIELIKTTNKEYELVDIMYTEEEAIVVGVEKLEKELDEKIENKESIVNKQINTYGNKGFIEIEVIYEVLEDIGVERK